MTDSDVGISPALAEALHKFKPFLVSDDAEREQVISESDPAALRELADSVDPLYPEINAVLDRLGSRGHPLPSGQELLEYDLNSLAQAAMEARMQLDV